jgi:hypothetical protein
MAVRALYSGKTTLSQAELAEQAETKIGRARPAAPERQRQPNDG